MKTLGRILLIVVVGVLVIGGGLYAWFAASPKALDFAGQGVELAAYKGPSPTGPPADLAASDPIARGRYLAQAADCAACHTSRGGQLFAGGLAFHLPFGTIYSPNITADKDTGIGSWSDAQFLGALHRGVDDQGQPLYPAMPYPAYTYMTDADALAIKAYIFSLPAVKNTPPENSLKFPFDQRWAMSIWSRLFNANQRFRPHPDRSPEWNRGAYLAEAMAHCGDCHTPRTLVQSLDNRRKFAGAVAAGWKGYNITAHRLSGVGAWSDDELAQYLASGQARGRGTANGPMAEAVDLSFSKLTPSDIRALVAYVRTVPAVSTPSLPAPAQTPAPSQPKQGVAAGFDPRGKQIFEGACASCHGWTGAGQLTPWATLTGVRAVNDATATNVAAIVLAGANRRTGSGSSLMPAFGHAYSDAEIAAVANYVTARFGAKPSRITARQVANLRKSAN